MIKIVLEKYEGKFSPEIIDINLKYFKNLFEKYVQNEAIELVMNDGINQANCFPLPILSERELNELPIQDYEKLEDYKSDKLKGFTLEICKMQAGLGTSVARNDLLEKYTNRTELGAKGTDLFIKYQNRTASIAEVQLLLAEDFIKQDIVSGVKFKNLVNSETKKAVEDIWNLKYPDSKITYDEAFSTEKLSKLESVEQLMMPTVDEDQELSFEREAPGGQAFIGFYELMSIFVADEASSSIRGGFKV